MRRTVERHHARAATVCLSFGIWLSAMTALCQDAAENTPPAPGSFAGYEVLNYAKRTETAPTGQTQQKGTRLRSTAEANCVETWVVRSPDNPASTYAVRLTTENDGEFSLCAYSPNRVLAWLAPGQSYEAFANEMQDAGFRIVRELMRDSDNNPVYIVESDDTLSDNVEVMTAVIDDTGMCSKITKNWVFDLTGSPNDPRLPEQYGLEAIGASQAWDTRTDASSVLVAVLDSGVNYNHVDLRGNVWVNEGEIPGNGEDDDGNGIADDVFGMSSIKGIRSGDPLDEYGHGTHCTGIIGAEGNNNRAVAGVAWKARIMGLKFVGPTGKNAETVDTVSCLVYADKMGVKIINCSFGWDNMWDDCLYEQMKIMSAKGVIFVCAAGNAKKGFSPKNTDEKPFYPASWNAQLDTVVSVAATDADDELAYFSYYGGNTVDIAAPGDEVYSTYLGSTGLEHLSGTSMATPHVTGALALLWAHYPDESATNILNRLYAAAEPLESLRGKVKGGRRLSMAGFFGIPAPEEIYVTQGTEADAVVIYWAGSKDATHYRVWRAETENGQKTMLRDWSQSLTFSDTDIAPGVTNWYFLQAAKSSSGYSASVYSEGIPGFRPSADTSRITVSFNPAGGTVKPASKVYRVGETYSDFPTPSYPGKAFLGWHSDAVGGARIDADDEVRRDVTTLVARWTDENALRIENLAARQRYPWNGLVDIDFTLQGVPNGASASVSLTASNPSGVALPLSTFVSASPSGLTNGTYHFIWNATPDTQNSLYPDLVLYAAVSVDLPPAPSSGTATNNPATRAIDVSWSAVSGATSYQIWSGTTDDFAEAELLATQGGTTLTDLSATVGGQVYHYWIRTVSPGGVSADALHLSVTRDSYEEPGSMDACLYPFTSGWNNRGIMLVHEDEANNSTLDALSPVFRFNSEDMIVLRPCVGNIGETTITELDFRVVCEDESGNKVAQNDSYLPVYAGGLEPGYVQVNLLFGMDSMQSLDPGNYMLYAAVDPDGKYGDVRPSNNIAEYHFAIMPETNVDFRTALDCPKMTFSAGANDANPPFAQTWKSNEGGSAMQFGPQNHSETNSLLATVLGPGTLTFSIWCDTESGYDCFEFLVDGVRRTVISGEFDDWKQKIFTLAAGAHQLEWRYGKDSIYDGGHDVVYLDTVSWTPTETESLDPVTGLAAMGTEAGVSLAWNAVEGASSYDVYAYRGGDTFTEAVLKGTTANTDFFDASALPSSTPLYYWIRPRCALGLGPVSAAAQALWMLPDLGFALPSEQPWPDGVYLSSTNAPFVEKTSFVQGETILLHGCVGNYGNAAISNQYTMLHEVTAIPSGKTLSSLLVDCAGATFMLEPRVNGNGFTWDNATFAIPSTLPPGNYKYRCLLDSGNNIVEIDEENNLCEISFAVLRTASGMEEIGLAVENSELAFTTGGDAEWDVDTTESYSGGSCAKSGVIDDGESTWMQTEVSGPGRLTFMGKTSCEENFDKLAFLVDGVQKTYFSGIDAGWHEYGCDILGDGTHVLRWVYSKDSTVANGDDCCWVDSIVWTPAAEPTFTISDGILTHVELNGTSDVVIPDGVTAIGNGVFEGTYVASVKCPSSLRTIGVYAFHECTSLTNITFHAGLQTIQDWAFCGCSSLTGVFEIPEGVTDVAFGAFMWSGVNTLVFPSTLNHLGAQIVLNNPLVAVYFKGNAPQLDEVGTSAYPNEKSPYCSANANLVTYVPVGSTGWKDSTTALPATWPLYESRPIQHYFGTPPLGTSGVVIGK